MHAGVLKAFIDGLVQDCSNSIANALELLHSKKQRFLITCWCANIIALVLFNSAFPNTNGLGK